MTFHILGTCAVVCMKLEWMYQDRSVRLAFAQSHICWSLLYTPRHMAIKLKMLLDTLRFWSYPWCGLEFSEGPIWFEDHPQVISFWVVPRLSRSSWMYGRTRSLIQKETFSTSWPHKWPYKHLHCSSLLERTNSALYCQCTHGINLHRYESSTNIEIWQLRKYDYTMITYWYITSVCRRETSTPCSQPPPRPSPPEPTWTWHSRITSRQPETVEKINVI